MTAPAPHEHWRHSGSVRSAACGDLAPCAKQWRHARRGKQMCRQRLARHLLEMAPLFHLALLIGPLLSSSFMRFSTPYYALLASTHSDRLLARRGSVRVSWRDPCVTTRSARRPSHALLQVNNRVVQALRALSFAQNGRRQDGGLIPVSRPRQGRVPRATGPVNSFVQDPNRQSNPMPIIPAGASV